MAEPSTPSGGEFMPATGNITPRRSASGPLSAEELITLNEEIAAMARAGLPLDQGLRVLAHEMGRSRLRTLTQNLADDLRAGHSLPDALQRQKGSFPSYYAALLSAGIRCGRLGDVLKTLTVYARSIVQFRETVLSIVLYPAMVLVLGMILFVYVGYEILPPYEEIFAGFKMKVPIITRIVMYLGKHPISFFVMPSLIFILGVAAERWWLRRTPRGRMTWARIVYFIPVIGSLTRSARLAAFCDLLGILIDQAVPLPEALRLAAEASSDPLLTEGTKLIDAPAFGKACRWGRRCIINGWCQSLSSG